MMYSYLVVYEDLYRNKSYQQTKNIKQTILDILNDFDVALKDKNYLDDKYTNYDFIGVGGLGDVIYDIDIVEKDDQEQYNGRICIFVIDKELL